MIEKTPRLPVKGPAKRSLDSGGGAGVMFEYQDFDAVGLAELIGRGEVSPTEVAEAAIARIEALNPKVNAVVTPLFERARRAAESPPAGRLAGVPILLKDILGDLAGVETRCGSQFMAGAPADKDHTLVRRFQEAGLVILGKTNVPEFGMAPVTTSRLYGPARNPWDLTRTTGGSSGGAAAAVALGFVPVAHGGDAGGSIRMPAAHCGLVGLKPTRGRNPTGPDAGEPWVGFLQEHVLTRTVRDSAAVLDETQGPEPGDRHQLPPPAQPYLQQIGRPPERLRVLVTVEAAGESPLDPECRKAVEGTAKALEELGHIVEVGRPPAWAELLDPALTLGAACMAQDIQDHAARTGKVPGPEAFEPAIWELYKIGREVSATSFLAALARVEGLVRRFGEATDTFDVWVTPTVPTQAARFDELSSGEGRFDALAYVLVGNATGRPSISLPLHWTADGIPVGVLFTGRFGADDMLLRLAAQLEAARPWRDRRPPTWS